MIGLPFGDNDTECLSAASMQAAELVDQRDPLLVEYAQQFRTKEEAWAHIRSLPQRDDEGIPHGWIERVKRAIRTLAWRYNADRMVMDYVRHCYMPAAGGETCRM